MGLTMNCGGVTFPSSDPFIREVYGNAPMISAMRPDGTFPTFTTNRHSQIIELPRSLSYRLQRPVNLSSFELQPFGLGQPAIGDYAVAGSKIAWGGYIADAVGNKIFDEKVERAVKQKLWESGGFSWVDAGKIAGFLNHYVSIKVTLANDFSHLNDVLNLINGSIFQAGFTPENQAFWVESIPPEAMNRQDIATPGTGGSTNPGAQTSPGILDDIQAWWDSLKFPSFPNVLPDSSSLPPGTKENLLDKLARWLGVTPSQAMIVGAVGSVVAVVAIKRVL